MGDGGPESEPRELLAAGALAAARAEVLSSWGAAAGADDHTRATVVDAVIDALRTPAPERKLTEVAARIAASCPMLSVADLTTLRALLQQICIERLDRAAAVPAVSAVSTVVDELVERLHADEVLELASAALCDPLTGVGNRRALEREYPQMRAVAARHNEPIALVLIDLDGLKTINDRYGHHAGDSALTELTAGLKNAPRGADSVYRLGGDEFVLLLASTDTGGAHEVLRRLPADLPRFTYGVASAPLDGDDLATVLAVADHRLIDAKRGRMPTRSAAVAAAAPVDGSPSPTGGAAVAGGLSVAAGIVLLAIVSGRAPDLTASLAMQGVAIGALSLAAIALIGRVGPVHRVLVAGPIALGIWFAIGATQTSTSPRTPLESAAESPAGGGTPPSTTVPQANQETAVGPAIDPSPAASPAIPTATPPPTDRSIAGSASHVIAPTAAVALPDRSAAPEVTTEDAVVGGGAAADSPEPDPAADVDPCECPVDAQDTDDDDGDTDGGDTDGGDTDDADTDDADTEADDPGPHRATPASPPAHADDGRRGGPPDHAASGGRDSSGPPGRSGHQRERGRNG